jgi:hypothetical protein
MLKMIGAAVAIAASAAAADPVGIAEFLPKAGTHQVRQMQVMAPAEASGLADRMTAAAQRNLSWFQQYAAQHEGKEGMLPYHPNLGLSEAEYGKFVSLIGQMALRETGRAQVSVAASPEGALALSASGGAAALNGIVIHPRQDFVHTPSGRLTHRISIDQDDPKSPTGRWKGVQWSNGDATAQSAKLAVGRRENGEMMIYYAAAGSQSGPLILVYDQR